VKIVFSISLLAERGATRNPDGLLSRLSWRRRCGQVKRRDKETCQYCGEPAPKGQVDHVLPLSRGGTDSLDNLKWACPTCNASKGADTVSEWTIRLLMEGRDIPKLLDRYNAALTWDIREDSESEGRW